MKKRLAFLLAIAAATTAFLVFRQPARSENPAAAPFAPTIGRAQSFPAVRAGVSSEVRSFADRRRARGDLSKIEARAVSENPPAPPAAVSVGETDGAPARLLSTPLPAPSLAFDGLVNRDNAEIFGVFFLPSDTNGDVGPNHYVQTVNTLVRVFDKTGAALTPPFRMSDLFAPLGTVCATRNDGLGIVLYDSLADRWLLSQYCNAFPPFRQMLAVSQTGDPLGAYHIYEFAMPNVRLNDYAKFGVWPDGYYMTTDEFVGSDYVGAGLFAFDRRKILRGDPTAGYIYFNAPVPGPARTGGFLPADLDGLTPPPAGAPNVFAGYAANEYGQPQDAIRLYDFRADFDNPLASTFTERPESPLAVAAFDPTSPEGRADIAQPAPGEPLDSQSDRLMYRVAYRNFGTHEALVFNQTVRSSAPGAPYRAGVRVYELRRAGAAFAVHDQTTFGDDRISRWMAAAAQDHQGNLAFGYSSGNEEKPASILYSGRLASEPAGAFRPEQTLVTATGVQTAFGFRWGNFTGMTVDVADDCTFWLTNQYFSLASQTESPFSWLTRIGRFKFDECAPAPRAGLSGTIRSAASGAGLGGAVVTTDGGVYSRAANAGGEYGRFLLPPGTYTFTASAPGFRSRSATLTLAAGETPTRDFALEPVAVPESAGAALTAESCAPNNAPDPGETVTVAVALRNTGRRDTRALTATLLAGGGVTNPSAPQNYGALAVGGESVARPFTFRVAPETVCGGALVLTLGLRDGAENLGTAVVRLTTGTRRFALRENFDGVTVPQLPAGWTTSATGAQQNWATATAQTQSAPNSVFSPAPNQLGLNELVSPEFAVTTPAAEVEFRNWYELETTFLRNRLYDGAVLEIKLGDEPWQDIEAAGGAFLAGGYDGVIDACCQNPLAGRRGWSGRSGINQTSEFITSRAKLPAAAAGRSVRLRWRVGTDIGTFRTGQFIDELAVADGFACGCGTSAPRRAPFDFDGDGRTDLGVFRPSNAASEPDFLVEKSADNGLLTAVWGSVGDLPVPADFDGDGRTDPAVFRPSDGTWYILRSGDGTTAAAAFGLGGDRPAPFDFDGDGRADPAVFRPSDGTWYILQSGGGVRIQRFGLANDLPVAADFDGDGRADPAVFRPSDGTWYVFRSSDAQAAVVRFGLADDRPVAADFDGDGRADPAVFRPSDGNWYLLRSRDGFAVVRFGLADDRPLTADFDGDGRADIAVFRPSNAVWYQLRSSDGAFRAKAFGTGGDAPLAGVFVP